MSAFLVSGRLELTGAGGFTQEARQAEAALRGVGTASAQLNTSAIGAAAAMDRETGALNRAIAATRAKAQADREAKVASDNLRRGLTAQQSTALFQQGSDVVAQLAGGQNPFLVAIQQGPQLAQAFGNSFRGMASGIMSGLRAIPPQAVAVAAAVGLVVAPLAIGVSHAQQLNRELRQTDITLRATANSAGLTAREIQAAVTAQLGRPGAGRDDTFSSTSRLLANPILSGDAFTRTLAIARDFARVTGAELPQAADALANALDGTQASILKLDQVFRFLSIAEIEQIRRFEETGQKSEVVRIALAALERQFRSLNEQGASPAEKATASLRASWEAFKASLADSAVIRAARVGLEGLWATAKGMVRWGLDQASGGSGAATGDPVAAAKKGLTDSQKALLDAQDAVIDAERRATSLFAGRQAQSDLNDARERLRRATDEVNRHKAVVEKAEADVAKARDQGAAAAQAAADKEALAAAQRAATTENRRKAIDAEIAQQERLLKNEQVTAQTRASIQQQLEKLRGERATLETPAEQIEREARERARLAGMPQHLRAAEQAYQETYRRMLEATGDKVRALAAAEQARNTVLREGATATRQQVEALDDEAKAALQVAAAYGRSTAEALRMKAQLAAQSAERRGEIAPGTAGQAATAQLQRDAGAAVEAAAQRSAALRDELAGLEGVADAELRSSEAAREAARAADVATMATQLRAQAAASGSAAIIAAAEREIAVYDQATRRRLDIDRQRDAAQFNRQYDPDAAFADAMARLQALKDTGLLTARAVAEATKEYELQRLEASRDATDGMIAGLRRYADEALHFGRAAADGIAQGMRAGEDAIVSLVTKGKISFSSLTDSILADVARVFVRQGITGPISAGFSSILNSLFGGGGIAKTAEGGGGGGGGFLSAIGDFFGRLFHEGGVVGEGGRRIGPMPSWLWAGARRYHGGGPVLGPGEVPIIAMRGEEVLPATHPRHRDNAGRSGPAVTVNVINNGDSRVQTRERENGDGSLTIDVLIDTVESGLARNVAAGRGALHSAIAGSFDIDDRGRR